MCWQPINIERLYSSIKQVIEKGKDTAYRAVNATMVEVYWQIGELIVEGEQDGNEKADYGVALLEELSVRLAYIRQFYVVFPEWNAVRSEFSWTH